MLAAAAAFAEANEIRGAMRHRKRRSKSGILIARVAIRAKRLLIVAGKTIRLLRPQIQRMRENKIQIMHPRFYPDRFAGGRRPIFCNTATTLAARELRGHVGMARLAEIFGVTDRAIIRQPFGCAQGKPIDAHQTFVFFRPIRLLMRNRQQRFRLRVA